MGHSWDTLKQKEARKDNNRQQSNNYRLLILLPLCIVYYCHISRKSD